jgi:hypothetical protein
MKKVLFLFLFFLLTVSNSWKADAEALAAPVKEAVVIHHGYGDTDLPLGDGEEQSGEKDRDITEDDDDVSLDHRWNSRGLSSNSDLHILYQEKLFKDLEIKIVIPPPKA